MSIRIAALLTGLVVFVWAGDVPTVTHLRCEYLVDPLGLDETAPRLSWIVESPRRGERQTAYEILVASAPELLAKNQGDLWDSGTVASSENAQIVYAGKPLTSRQACCWKVRILDRDGKPSPWSTPARWEMGLLKAEDWSAHWIEGGLPSDSAASQTPAGANWIWHPDDGATPPAATRYFRRVIPIATMPQSARLLLMVDDNFILSINGNEVARVVEGWRMSHSFDLGALLKPGDNVIAVAATNLGGPAGLCAKVVLQYAGQDQQVVLSDHRWKVAEHDLAGWTPPSFDDHAWKDAAEIAVFGKGVWGGLIDAPAPVPILRTDLRVDKPVAKARLYATALGLYELDLNGRRVGDHLLAPDWTDYSKRIRYQAYDVTALLQPGKNTLAALLANGWYCGRIGLGGYRHYGAAPSLLAQLEVTYADGSSTRWVSDGSWRVHPSAITSSDLMRGEDHDARLELPGWAQPSLDTSAWPPAAERQEAPRPIQGQVSEPVRQTGEVAAKALSEPRRGCWTYEFGQNLVGVVRLKVTAPAGTVVTLRHAEMLNPDGTIYTANLRGAPSIDRYTCSGAGVEIWQPRFTFHGFRYVELSGLPTRPASDAATAIVIGSDTPQTGEFACSDPRINQLQSNIRWGQRGNYLSVPTDCPQRDERLGWMGDAQVFIRTATCNADVAAFFSKWLVDVDDGQSDAGAFGDVSPNSIGCSGVPGWGDAGVICPWTVYQVYGDTRVLQQHLPAMQRWVEWMRTHSTNLIRDRDRGNDYGDWLSQGADTPKDLIGTAYFAYSTGLVAKACAALGKPEEAARYQQLFQDIRKSFNLHYVAPDGRIQGDTQCGYAMALKFGLLDATMQVKAAEHLAGDISAHGDHLTTGFVGVSYLLPALTRAGRLDTAFKVFTQDGFPSWLFSIKHGATTIWERWDGWTPERGFQDPGMNSFNHYSLGSCGEWMYESLAGIASDEDKPAFRHIIIQPHVGGGITSARASMLTMRGKVVSDWKIHASRFTLDCTIPVGSEATVVLPATDAGLVREGDRPITGIPDFRLVGTGSDVRLDVGPGTYAFSCPTGH